MKAVKAWAVVMPFHEVHPANLRGSQRDAIQHYFGADEIPTEYVQQGCRCVPVTITAEEPPHE